MHRSQWTTLIAALFICRRLFRCATLGCVCVSLSLIALTSGLAARCIEALSHDEVYYCFIYLYYCCYIYLYYCLAARHIEASLMTR